MAVSAELAGYAKCTYLRVREFGQGLELFSIVHFGIHLTPFYNLDGAEVAQLHPANVAHALLLEHLSKTSTPQVAAILNIHSPPFLLDIELIDLSVSI